MVVSQYIGQRNAEPAGEAAKHLIYTILCVALLFMGTVLAFNSAILRLVYGILEPAVMEQSQIYFTLTALSYPVLALFHSGAAIFRSMGDSKTSMRVAFAMTLTNIGGNALFIYGFGMGVFGAGLATLLSRVLAGIFMVARVMKKNEMVKIVALLRVKFDWPMIRRILRIGIPNSIENGIFHIGKIMVQSLTASFGTTALAANAIGFSIASIANVPGSAIGIATITVVGQYM